MATEIESFIRAWAAVTSDGAGGFEWSGDGITSITQSLPGVYRIVFDDTFGPFDFKRTAFILTAGVEASNLTIASVDTFNAPDIDALFATDAGLPTDPSVWYLQVIAGNAEGEINPVL